MLATFCCRLDFGTVLIEIPRTLLQQEPSAVAEGSSRSLRHLVGISGSEFHVPVNPTKDFQNFASFQGVFSRDPAHPPGRSLFLFHLVRTVSWRWCVESSNVGQQMGASMSTFSGFSCFVESVVDLTTFIMNSERDQEKVIICKQCSSSK